SSWLCHPTVLGTLLLPRTAAKTNRSTLCAVLSLVIGSQLCPCYQNPKLLQPSGPSLSLVLPSLSCPPTRVPQSNRSLPQGTFPWPTSCVLPLQHIQLVEVPGSHFVHLNEPEVVSGIISDFLTAQNTRARL
uniref:Uncharacterized protein n=1 Tax=Otus sunia TaxID=257818 RepID=A0A8C8BL36_9STRI